MIVQCDKCGAKFHLADDKVTEKGAKVRCSKCKAVFTVKKTKEDAAAPAPEARPGKPPSPPASGKASGDDPFSDFNFSDDLDFNEGEDKLTVEAPAKPAAPPPAPPPAPEPGFSSAPPPRGAKKPASPAAPEAAGSDEGFDFSDEDFSLSDEPKAPAGPGPAPAPASAPAAEDFGTVDISRQPPPAPAKGGADDFGDFKFDDDSFSEKAPPPSPPPGPPPRGEEDWGNVSFSEASPAPAKAGRRGDEVEEAGFGDFQFDQDDHLPSGGAGADEGMPAADFVRSPTSRAPVRDDFEASIGDSESEPERREEARPAPPPPPKPVLKAEPRKAAKKGLGGPIIIVLMILAVPLGFVGYTNSRGWFTFDDLLHFRTAKLGPALLEIKYDWGLAERPDTGIVDYVEGSVQVKQLTRPDGLFEVAVSGQVVNNTRKTVQWIQSEVSLKDQNDRTVATGTSYCDVNFTDDELKSLSRDDILAFTGYVGGRTQKCIDIGPGQSRPFTVVFFPQIEPGMRLTLSRPRILSCKVLGNEKAPCPLTPPPGSNPAE